MRALYKAGKGKSLPWLTAIHRSDRTFGAAVDPGLYQFSRLFLSAGGGDATRAGIPGPADEVVLRDVFLQQRQRAAAVSLDVFQLTADVAERLVLPCHRQGSDTPARMPGNALVCGG